MDSLVIGARGSVGQHVVSQLRSAGASVRASARRVTFELPGVDLVEADLGDAESLKRALDGVRSVFLYAPLDGVSAFVEAARASAVERVVVLSSGSVLLPRAADNLIAREHRSMEGEFAASGLPFVPIRPLVLANNALNWARSIKERSAVRLVHPESTTAPVHERDIAALAVAALLGDDRPEVSAMLTGPDLLSQREQVAIIAGALGRPVAVEEIDESQARELFGDDETTDAVLWFIRDALAENASPRTDTFEHVTGRRPLPFSAWAKDNAASF